jgi:CMP-N-acetylneuraminic acid synthetase
MTDRPEVLAIVTARAGSRRLPGKNLLEVGGVPMLGLACRAARAARCVTRVVLSTEDRGLADVGLAHGAEVPFLRPAALAGDEASSIDVLLHALSAIEAVPDYVLLLQPSSPLRRPEDLDAAFGLLRRERPDGAVISVTASKPPQWIEILDGHRLLPAAGAPPPLQPGQRWVVPNGSFYFARVDYLRRQHGFDGPDTLGYVTDPLFSIDIDTPEELEVARRLWAGSQPR